MFYCMFQLGGRWLVIAVNRVVVFSMDATRLKHRLSDKWEFLNDAEIKHRETGMKFPYKIERTKS